VLVAHVRRFHCGHGWSYSPRITAHKTAHKNQHTRICDGGGGWACVLLEQDWFRPVPVAGADRWWGTGMVTEPALLCADAGPPTPQEWNRYVGEPQPKVCS
jgi:hypothetical protein